MKFSDKIMEYTIPNYYPIASAEDVVPIMLDLKLVLIINNTSNQFITSDCFVCKYNQFLLEKKSYSWLWIWNNRISMFYSNITNSLLDVI